MLDLEDNVRAEYDRVTRNFEPIIHFGEPCLTIADVLKAHYLIANHFLLEGSGIGGIGPIGKGLLESTVYRQVSSFRGRPKWTGLFDVTATLFYGIVKNHAFHDANKRTGFLTALFQLYKNGFCPSVHEKQLEDFTVDVADNKLGKYSRYRDLVKSKQSDPEVKFISKYFRDNTRRIDNSRYIVTYRELQGILKRYDFFLESPDQNYIDIVKYIHRKKVFGIFGRDEDERVRVGRIGFPRWGAQVSPATLKMAREMTGLTAKLGVDSGAFFHGLDPMQSLITTYNEPLLRLADR